MPSTSALLPFIVLFLSPLAFAETRIGAMAELSGPMSRTGEDCRKGYEVAEDEFRKGHPADRFSVVLSDNQGDPKAGLSEFQRLIQQEKIAAVVTSRSPVGMALNPVAYKQKIPLVGIVGHPRFVIENSLAIRSYPSATDEAKVLTDLMARHNEQSIATVTLEDEYFVGLNSTVSEILGRERVKYSETITPSDTDFSSILMKIRTAAPSAIFVNVGPQQLKPFIKKLKELGLKQRVYSNFLIGLSDIQKALGPDGDGIYYAELDYKKPFFLAAHRELFGDNNSSAVGYSCYIGMLTMLEILHRAADSTAPLHEVFGRDFDLTTADGMIEIRNREAKLSVLPMQLVTGEAKVVSVE
jgi:ABC-type branched-subunit amino acid transport system substrate-binding protein